MPKMSEMAVLSIVPGFTSIVLPSKHPLWSFKFNSSRARATLLACGLGKLIGYDVFLIVALIFSAGYYSAPIFSQFKEFELFWCAVF